MSLNLNLSFNRSLDRKSILVTDLTGSGTTGYGGSNPSVGDFTNFNIIVTPADPITLLPTGTPVTIAAYPSLPSAIDGTFTITSLALVGVADTVIPDGVYLFSIEADYEGSSEGTATGTFYKIYYEIVQCCIQNMTIEAAQCRCSGDSQKRYDLLEANMWLGLFEPVVFNDTVGLSPLAENGQWNLAASLLVALQEVCNNQNCKDCGGC